MDIHQSSQGGGVGVVGEGHPHHCIHGQLYHPGSIIQQRDGSKGHNTRTAKVAGVALECGEILPYPWAEERVSRFCNGHERQTEDLGAEQQEVRCSVGHSALCQDGAAGQGTSMKASSGCGVHYLIDAGGSPSKNATAQCVLLSGGKAVMVRLAVSEQGSDGRP